MTKQASDSSESEQDHAYFRALEETFIELRGAPLMLSPADWQVAKSWRRAGIPLELAIRVLERIFARQESSEKKAGIRGLRYFRKAVEQSWRQIVEMGGGGGAQTTDSEPLDVEERLERLSAAVARVSGTKPALEDLPDRIRELSGSAKGVEEQLARIDVQVLAALRADLEGSVRDAIETKVEEALAGMADRLGGDGLDALREALFKRYLREVSEIPVLSLFSPEALGSIDSD